MAKPRKSAEILKLEEVAEKGYDGKAVRVIGRLKMQDNVNCLAVLSSVERDSTVELTVDTKLVMPVSLRPSSLYQFFGELDDSDDHFILRARIVTCVDGMDVIQYYKVLDIQRKYLANRQPKYEMTTNTVCLKDFHRTTATSCNRF
ncbi:CST complex subunit TEN1-like [Saccoglossus kowalevskii]|uniref:CST complex subunit TEN1-like n=1 Tax=Saccoglossus kowalevskii TaxID=10224 RepID=A0ABM0M5K8_SACKO|nr:PREDICTED: CST complex subunit TEN1-like [Saccoglossus kowalevskii]